MAATTSPSSVQTAIVMNPAIDPGNLASPPGNAGVLSRSHILDATGACFAESGYDGTTIRAIAGRLGCSVGSIYRYFQDKRDLLLACGNRVFMPTLEEIERGGVTLEDSLRTYLQQATGHGELYRLLFWLTAGEGEGGVPEPVRRVIDGWAALLGDRGRAERCWAMVHGMVMLGCGVDRILDAAGGLAVGLGGERYDGSSLSAEPQAAWVKEDVTLL